MKPFYERKTFTDLSDIGYGIEDHHNTKLILMSHSDEELNVRHS